MKKRNSRNALWNCTNPYQGDYKKVLCVCSAGLLRSPTTALILSKDPYNFNTRAVGLDEGHALIAVDEVLLAWADTILCMNDGQKTEIERLLKELGYKKGDCVISLDIEDSFPYRDKELVSTIEEKVKDIFPISE